MTYEEWLVQVPDSLKNDPIWKFEAYPNRIALCDEIIALLVVTIRQRRSRRHQ